MRSLFVFLAFLCLPAAAINAASLYIPVQFLIENGNYDGSLVILKKNGVTQFSIPGERNLQLKLDFNEEYLVAFSKPGYITKQIAVDTHAPEERIANGFEPYKIGVRLYKQYAGVNIVVYNQPVASIKYISDLDEIGYDTDYTKSILSLLTETENKLAVKANEERKKLKQATGNSKPDADFDPIIPDATSEKDHSKQTLQTTDTSPGSSVNNKNTPAESMSAQQAITPSGDNNKKNNKSAGYGEDDPAAAASSGGSDTKNSDNPAEGQDENRIVINTGKGNDPRISNSGHVRNYSKTKEEIFEQHRTITTITVRLDNKTSVYHQVKYLTGECYYFMNGSTAISAHLFEYFTGENH